jgi:SAM-dependent methyltransferase
MTHDDLRWIENILAAQQLDSPVLELGAGYGGMTCRKLIEGAGFRYYGTDLEKTPGVDFAANFECSEDMSVFSSVAPFGAALVLNVLEHTFDPIRILDNVISLLKLGGKCVVLTPSIWPLHNYPMDTWRILPNLYEEYARRRGLVLDHRFFDYVGQGTVQQFRNADGTYCYPPPCGNKARHQWSRVIHKMFNTSGRGMLHPSHVGLGAIFQRPVSDKDAK